MKKFWENYKFSFTLLLGIFVGALIGVVMGEKATALEPIGQIFLNLMFTIVVPMVFVSIASSVGSILFSENVPGTAQAAPGHFQ